MGEKGKRYEEEGRSHTAATCLGETERKICLPQRWGGGGGQNRPLQWRNVKEMPNDKFSLVELLYYGR